MTDRFDLAISEEGQDGKKYWRNIGVMFPSKKGEGFNIKVYGPHGVSWISAFPAKERDDTRKSEAPRSSARSDDDEIPF